MLPCTVIVSQKAVKETEKAGQLLQKSGHKKIQ